MQSTHVVVESETPITIRGQQVCGMFDAPPAAKQRLEWTVEAPLSQKPWQIGLVYGPSGSGKSTVARRMFGEESRPAWQPRTALVDNFPPTMKVAEIAELCGAVGLNTIPCWLRPHEVLSNGEKFRADMAKLLAEAQPGQIVWVDEFTSVVDRQVAQVASHALQKVIRKRPDLKFVAVSCHSDIIEWLRPDWTIDMGSNAHFDWGRLRCRPKIKVVIAQAERSEWSRFARYHYMSASLARNARCFGLWVDGKIAAFTGLIFRPHPTAANIYGVSRVVTLPDYQGLGLAFILLENIGAMLRALGWRLRNYPAHPPFTRAHDRSPNWALKKRPGQIVASGNMSRAKKGRAGTSAGRLGGRPCAVYEYIGPGHPDVEQALRVTGFKDRGVRSRR